MLKTFKVTYVRHGNVCDYNHEQIIKAVSEKMAIKKFWNYREYPTERSNREAMEYERQANGIWWSDIKAQLIEQ